MGLIGGLGDVGRGNADAVRRLMEEVWGLGKLDLLPVLIAPGYVAHLPIGDHYGPDGVRIDIVGYRAVMPDLTVELEEVFALGDTVVRRFVLGGTFRASTPNDEAPGRPVRLSGIGVDRVAGGMLIESWVVLAGIDTVWPD